MTIKLSLIDLSIENRIARVAWSVVWLLFFRPTPRILHAWRCFLLRRFGAQLGRKVHIYPSTRIWAPWNLEMKDHACLGDHVDCYCVAKIFIGARATVSQYCHLCSASHDYTKAAMPLVAAPIRIESDAWVTTDVFVGPGVTVGEGAVVLARSSVFRSIPPWTVAKGNPAQAVRERLFDKSPPSQPVFDE